MKQIVQDTLVYIVEFEQLPKLPIVANDENEVPYAMALQNAIEAGFITKGGKYGININPNSMSYMVYAIVERAEPNMFNS